MVNVHIEIDEREVLLYEHILRISQQNTDIIITKKVLPLGDVVIYMTNMTDTTETQEDTEKVPVAVIERKTFQDLFASIKDGRYQEQSYRLLHSKFIHSPHSVIYLIEGMITRLKDHEQSLLYSSIASLNMYKGFSVYRTAHMQETADFVFSVAKKVWKNAKERKEFPLCYRPQNDQELDPSIETPTNHIPTPPPYSSVVEIGRAHV